MLTWLRNLWRLMFPPPVTYEQCVNALSLTDAIPTEAVQAWTPRQRWQAVCWAWREHLVASDNDIPRLPEPPHVKVLPRNDWREGV